MDSLCELRNKYNQLDIHFMFATDCLVLDRIVVPKELRKQGIGSNFMKDLISLADKNNWLLMLSPCDSLGATSVDRLRKFYKRFGFVRNSNKTKRYELPNYGMYRVSKATP